MVSTAEDAFPLKWHRVKFARIEGESPVLSGFPQSGPFRRLTTHSLPEAGGGKQSALAMTTGGSSWRRALAAAVQIPIEHLQAGGRPATETASFKKAIAIYVLISRGYDPLEISDLVSIHYQTYWKAEKTIEDRRLHKPLNRSAAFRRYIREVIRKFDAALVVASSPGEAPAPREPVSELRRLWALSGQRARIEARTSLCELLLRGGWQASSQDLSIVGFFALEIATKDLLTIIDRSPFSLLAPIR